MITQNACIDLHQTGSVGEGSDHLQLIKFWLSFTPGNGSVVGRKFLAPPYYSQCSVFASLRALFSLMDVLMYCASRLNGRHGVKLSIQLEAIAGLLLWRRHLCMCIFVVFTCYRVHVFVHQ